MTDAQGQASKPPTIVVVGGINMDLIAIAERLPNPGETVAGQRFYTAPGGKGANQAVAAARLGATVRLVGRVGDDEFGPSLIRGLEAAGVDVSGVSLDSEHVSGVAVILLDGRRQNHIVAVYGANLASGPAEVEAARTLLVDADVLMLQMEVPAEVSLACARHAREAGATVLWDPAPAGQVPDEFYAAVDVVTPNQSEAEVLTGIAVEDIFTAREAADELVARGVELAVIKLGEEGAYYSRADGSGFVSAPHVDVVDTIGAGDAFGAALAVALAQGRPVREAVLFGVAAGSAAVTRPGAQEAMPDLAAVDRLYGSP